MDLKKLAKARGTNLKRIAEECDIPKSTLYAIASGDTNFDNVGISNFVKLADKLGMSAEELYRGETPKGYMCHVTKDERELLDCYRSADARGRASILEAARRERAFQKDGVGGEVGVIA